MSHKQRLLVVGNGPVGHQFLESIVESGCATDYQITVIGEEPRPAYDRVHLTAWFETRQADALNMVADGFYATNNIDVRCAEKVVAIDRNAKTATTDSGRHYDYDQLVLATGSYPFVPPVPGHERENCFVYRTIEDLEAITAAAKNASVGAVVGGGLLGLEAAKAIKDLGLKTHVIEFAPRLMAVQVDDGGGALLRRKIEDLGVEVHTQKNTQNIGDGEHCVHKLSFADGAELETDILVFSAGIRPQDALARQCELEIGERGGIAMSAGNQHRPSVSSSVGEWRQEEIQPMIRRSASTICKPSRRASTRRPVRKPTRRWRGPSLDTRVSARLPRKSPLSSRTAQAASAAIGSDRASVS